MKKKTWGITAVVIGLFFGLAAFFAPLSLADRTGENQRIQMVYQELGVRDGEPYIDSVSYQEITTEQNRALAALWANYPYRRTLGTPFSDGSLSGAGDQILYVYLYDEDSLANQIIVSSSGEIAVNDKNYRMKNAEQWIGQTLEIVEQAD